LNNARTKSRDARRIADVKQIQTALELYFTDNSEYPPTPASGDCTDPGGDTDAANQIAGCCLSTDGDFASACSGQTTYMGVVPDNPDPNGINYLYTVNGTGNDSYTLQYNLEQDTAGVSSGLHTATPSGIANP